MSCDRKIGPFDCCSVVEGDCLELMKLLPDGCVDAVITDPPYGLCEQDGKVQMRGDVVVSPDYASWDTHDFRWLRLISASAACVFHDQRLATELWQAMEGSDWKPRRFVFWDKGDGGLNPRHNFVNAIEMALWATRDRTYTWNGGGSTINVFRRQRCPTPFHPTQKPIELMSWLAMTEPCPCGLYYDRTQPSCPFCNEDNDKIEFALTPPKPKQLQTDFNPQDFDSDSTGFK